MTPNGARHPELLPRRIAWNPVQAGHEDGDVVVVALGMLAPHQCLTGVLQRGVLGGESAAERVEYLLDVLPAGLHQAVGAQQEEAAGVREQFQGVEGDAAHSDGCADGDLQQIIAAVGPHEDWRKVAGAGEGGAAGRRVVDAVQAGGQLGVAQVLCEGVELGQ